MISFTELPVGPEAGPVHEILKPVCPGVPSFTPRLETPIIPKPPLQGILAEVIVGMIGCIGLIVKFEVT